MGKMVSKPHSKENCIGSAFVEEALGSESYSIGNFAEEISPKIEKA